MPFVKGKSGFQGRKHNLNSKEKMSVLKLGNKNPKWKVTGVGYKSLHNWVRRHLLRPKFCVSCKINPPLDVANISGKYLRDLTDWEWLCRKCHMIKDFRMERRDESGKFTRQRPYL